MMKDEWLYDCTVWMSLYLMLRYMFKILLSFKKKKKKKICGPIPIFLHCPALSFSKPLDNHHRCFDACVRWRRWGTQCFEWSCGRCCSGRTGKWNLFPPQLYGRAGAKSRLPPGAGAEITNCGSGSSSGSFVVSIIKDSKKFIENNHGCWRSFCKLLLRYKINPNRVKHAAIHVKSTNTQGKKRLFSRYLIKLYRSGAAIRICCSSEPEPKEKVSAPQYWSPVLVASEVLYKIRLEYYKHFHSKICLIEVKFFLLNHKSFRCN